MEACLAAGADLNARNNGQHNLTPLHWTAGYNENPWMIQALLTAGADPNKRDSFKFTPLHWAVEESKNRRVIQALLTAGADPNVVDGCLDSSLLHVAAQCNESPAVIQALLAGGANPNAQNVLGYTPLYLVALSNANSAVVEQLLAGGAQCAFTTDSSSNPEPMTTFPRPFQATRQQIQAACERLAALGVSNCQCP